MLDALIVNATNSNPPSLNCGLFAMGWQKDFESLMMLFYI